MALKLTVPHFKVGEFDGDTPPYIYVDDFTGNETSLTRNQMTFRLKPGTTVEQAQGLRNAMADLIVAVGEQA